MAVSYLTPTTVQLADGHDLDWPGAIKLAAQPLVDNHSIGADYVQSMIDVVKQQGPYINIGAEIALAHSRPSKSVKKVGLSLLKLTHDVNLIDDKHPVKLWFVLAATDDHSHLEVIKQLTQVLMDPDKNKQLLAATSKEQILAVFNQ